MEQHEAKARAHVCEVRQQGKDLPGLCNTSLEWRCNRWSREGSRALGFLSPRVRHAHVQ